MIVQPPRPWPLQSPFKLWKQGVGRMSLGKMQDQDIAHHLYQPWDHSADHCPRGKCPGLAAIRR